MHKLLSGLFKFTRHAAQAFEIITSWWAMVDRMVRPRAEHVKHLDIAPAVRGRGETICLNSVISTALNRKT